MVGSVGPKSSPVFLLGFLLWVLQCYCAWAAPLGDFGAISLSFNFTITPHGQPWCKIQGQINGNAFLDYNCNSQKNAKEAWERQTTTLKGLLEEFKMKLLAIKTKIIKVIDSFSLQGTIMCKQESNGHISVSWEFGFDGHKSLLFDTENKSFTVLRPEGELLKESLESDRAMIGDLVSMSKDCRDWLLQVSRAQGEVLSTKAPSTTATVPSSATTMPITSILPVILISLIIVGVLG
ncbi:UL16-binding protein 1-like [Eptesicus fuscus]|uniref:UL16-binding protein 1-like n=1 Tax=Eptesicus fuscus TaxID=29078 RepID=UPI0024040753|nr:UL16-binding protein 1-like [Eptesicus fuscus]